MKSAISELESFLAFLKEHEGILSYQLQEKVKNQVTESRKEIQGCIPWLIIKKEV